MRSSVELEITDVRRDGATAWHETGVSYIPGTRYLVSFASEGLPASLVVFAALLAVYRNISPISIGLLTPRAWYTT